MTVAENYRQLLADRTASMAWWDPAEFRAARRTLKLTQVEAALVIGCAQSTVLKWENHEYVPRELYRAQVIEFIELAEKVREGEEAT